MMHSRVTLESFAPILMYCDNEALESARIILPVSSFGAVINLAEGWVDRSNRANMKIIQEAGRLCEIVEFRFTGPENNALMSP